MKALDDTGFLLSRANELLKYAALERPHTPNRKKSLKKLQKVLHDLDDVTRVMLGEVPGANWKGPVQNMQEQIALCLKYWTVSKGYDLLRLQAATFLVQVYQAKFDRSPLTDPKHFAKWAEPITLKHGLKPPGGRILKKILQGQTVNTKRPRQAKRRVPTV